jgi:hypothetical protein
MLKKIKVKNSTNKLKVYKNVGGVDRMIRLISGIVLFIFSITALEGLYQFLLVMFSLMLLGTGIFGFCGIYQLIGISTCPISNKDKIKK